MAEQTNIEWADHTFNPWIGCTKVSPACDHCYAEAQTKRFDPDTDLWSGGRRRTSESNWKQPLKWNREAAAFRARHGRPPMVFCASLADVFDNQVPDEWRRDLWALIDATPDLIWLLLTKRPQNIRKMVPREIDGAPLWSHVWFGTTVENQAEADRRIPHLLAVPAAKHFLSCEPLLGPVNLRAIDADWTALDALKGDRYIPGQPFAGRPEMPAIDWVIAGGESGREARPSHPDWFRSLRDQCAAAGVPFLFKQWGEWTSVEHMDSTAVGDRWAAVSHDGVVRGGLQTPRDGEATMVRLTKARCGRLLDGVIHDARPGVL